MKDLKPLDERTLRKSWQRGSVLLGVGLARTGWFADDNKNGTVRQHYIFNVRVVETDTVIGLSLTFLPVYLLLAKRRKEAL